MEALHAIKKHPCVLDGVWMWLEMDPKNTNTTSLAYGFQTTPSSDLQHNVEDCPCPTTHLKAYPAQAHHLGLATMHALSQASLIAATGWASTQMLHFTPLPCPHAAPTSACCVTLLLHRSTHQLQQLVGQSWESPSQPRKKKPQLNTTTPCPFLSGFMSACHQLPLQGCNRAVGDAASMYCNEAT